MLIHTQAIVLQVVRYQEKSLIVKCYTKETGSTTFFVRNAFTKSKKTISYFQPFTLLNVSFVDKKNKDFNYFKSIDLAYHYQTLHTNFHKTNVVIFLAEVFNVFLKNEPPNESLFLFLAESFQWFDSSEDVNFHLYVLSNYIKYAGFFPDVQTKEYPYFNFVKGYFSFDYELGQCFKEEDSQLFKKIFEISKGDVVKLVGKERRLLLQLILNYCSEHLEYFYPPKTLEVFSELYD